MSLLQLLVLQFVAYLSYLLIKNNQIKLFAPFFPVVALLLFIHLQSAVDSEGDSSVNESTHLLSNHNTIQQNDLAPKKRAIAIIDALKVAVSDLSMIISMASLPFNDYHICSNVSSLSLLLFRVSSSIRRAYSFQS